MMTEGGCSTRKRLRRNLYYDGDIKRLMVIRTEGVLMKTKREKGDGDAIEGREMYRSTVAG